MRLNDDDGDDDGIGDALIKFLAVNYVYYIRLLTVYGCLPPPTHTSDFVKILI